MIHDTWLIIDLLIRWFIKWFVRLILGKEKQQSSIHQSIEGAFHPGNGFNLSWNLEYPVYTQMDICLNHFSTAHHHYQWRVKQPCISRCFGSTGPISFNLRVHKQQWLGMWPTLTIVSGTVAINPWFIGLTFGQYSSRIRLCRSLLIGTFWQHWDMSLRQIHPWRPPNDYHPGEIECPPAHMADI